MDISVLLDDAFGRVREAVHDALDGIDPRHLTFRPDAQANTIGWLVWHLTRVQDDHLADLAGSEQVWTSAGWAKQFGLPFAETETGYGQDADAVAAVTTSAELLLGYHDAVHDRSTAYVRSLTASDLDDVIDTAWDPPVTRGTRLISVMSDDLQHAGQAAYLRGVAERRAGS